MRKFRRQFELAAHCYLILDPRPGLHIIDINDAFGHATMTKRMNAAGGRIFDIFPDNPGEPSADRVSNLYSSFRSAAETGRPHAMPVQRYDIRNSEGKFVERCWRPLNKPIIDSEGDSSICWLMQRTSRARHCLRREPLDWSHNAEMPRRASNSTRTNRVIDLAA